MWCPHLMVMFKGHPDNILFIPHSLVWYIQSLIYMLKLQYLHVSLPFSLWLRRSMLALRWGSLNSGYLSYPIVFGPSSRILGYGLSVGGARLWWATDPPVFKASFCVICDAKIYPMRLGCILAVYSLLSPQLFCHWGDMPLHLLVSQLANVVAH